MESILSDMYRSLFNLYWFIRYYKRNKSARRRYYRYVAKERMRLIKLGVDTEEIRLLCRHLSNPLNQLIERRLIAHRKKLEIQNRI